MMNRRGFLGALAAAIAGATLDPERLLWEPGRKLISIPKPFGNRLLSRSDITRQTLEFLKVDIEALRFVQRDFRLYSPFQGPKIGDTIYIRRPSRMQLVGGAL